MSTINGKYISRKDVAEALGVSEQSVSNYIKGGLLKGSKINNNFYIDRGDFEKVKDSLVRVVNTDKRIEDYEAERAVRLEEVKKSLDELNSLNEQLFKVKMTMRTRGDIIHNIMVGVAKNIMDRYAGNRLMYAYNLLGKMTLEEYAQDRGRHISTIVQNMFKAVRETAARVAGIDDREKEINALRERCMRQHEYIKDLERQTKKEYESVDVEKCKLLDTKIVDCNLSTRCTYLLTGVDIETIGQLVSMNKTDILKIRNFGKKSLTEVDNFLESLNLHFGMNTDEFVRE